MSREAIGAFLETLKNNPSAKEKLNCREQPKSEEEKIAAYVALADEVGFSVTADDMKAYFLDQEQRLKRKTDSQAEEIQTLDDDDLAETAGGLDSPNRCKNTYQNGENCWVSDGCDSVLNHYLFYSCQSQQQQCGQYGPTWVVM